MFSYFKKDQGQIGQWHSGYIMDLFFKSDSGEKEDDSMSYENILILGMLWMLVFMFVWCFFV